MRCKSPFFVVVLLFASGFVTAQSASPPGLKSVLRTPSGASLSGRFRALLIGVDHYEQRNHFPALTYPQKDVSDLGGVLKGHGWEVTAMVASDRRLDPTSANFVVESVRAMAREAEADDTLMVFLAGHGVHAKEKGASESKDWFCLRTTWLREQKASAGNGRRSFHLEGGVDIEDLSKILKKSRARKTMLIADVCRSIPGRSVMDGSGIKLNRLRQSAVHSLFFSTSPGTRAMEPRTGSRDHHDRPMRNSLFMHFFLAGLKGQANLVHDDFITLREIMRFVHFELKSFHSKGGYGQVPVPLTEADEESDVLLARAPADRDGPELTVELPRPGASVRAGKVEFRGRVVDNASPCTVSVEGRQATVQGDKWFLQLDISAAGSYELSVVAKDARGNPTKKLVRVDVGAGDGPHKIRPTWKTPAWAEMLEGYPDPAEVDVRFHAAIRRTGLPWKVRDRKTGIVMLLIPPGSYTRGSPDSDDMAQDDEKPAHRVTITRAFYLGRTEMTNADYRRLYKKSHNSGKVRDIDLNTDQLPVVEVSWNDSQEFCARYGFRLPTDAEWEYAARAGSTTRFPWGNEANDAAGARWGNAADHNFSQTFPDAVEKYKEKFGLPFTWDDGHAGPSVVGSFLANGFGLRDTLGNVLEWCADSYDKGAYAKYRNGARDPVERDSGVSSRVLRGGSWDLIPRGCRSAYRGNYDRTNSDDIVGFRVARTP